MILVVLQNEYRDGGAKVPRDEWLPRLWESHTGRRLKEMLPDNGQFFVTNATLEVGDNADSMLPADTIHLSMVIEHIEPSIILACGQVAQRGLDELGVDYVAAPHPAWRRLSKDMTASIKEELTGRLS